MKFTNRKLRSGIAMSIATLFTASLIVSCQKDSSVTPSDTLGTENVSQSLNSSHKGKPTTTTTPTTTTPTTTTPTTSTSSGTYTASGPITAKSNTTYSGLVIDLGSSSNVGFTLNGVTNVHITNCKIINTKSFGINVNNSSNITIDNTLVSNVGFGIYVQNSKTVKVNSNQLLNLNGINTSSLGHAVQFNNVTGGGNQVNNNRIENITGVALHPHDLINLYKSSGLAGDSIQVIGNWIRGGQRSLWPTSGSGAAGIVVGDLGGNYQVCRNNILVNPGYVGIQAQGGNHIKVDHNKIYSDSTPASLVGMSWGNYSGLSSSDVTYAYNQVKWFNLRNLEDDKPANTSGLTLVNNTWGASITASILPATIITMK
jgi:hypothetical protein